MSPKQRQFAEISRGPSGRRRSWQRGSSLVDVEIAIAEVIADFPAGL